MLLGVSWQKLLMAYSKLHRLLLNRRVRQPHGYIPTSDFKKFNATKLGCPSAPSNEHFTAQTKQ